MTSFAFARTRRWVLGHITVLVFVSLFVVAGRWQLHRMHERQAFNRGLASRSVQPPEPLDTLIEHAESGAYRRTEATGTYLSSEEVLLEGRSLNGRAGRDVLTPLLVRPGVALIVDRGWIPISDTPIAEAAAPAGTVRVTGLLLPSERGIGVAVPQGTDQPGVSHVDLMKLGTHMPFTLLPLYLHMQTQTPSQLGDLPTPRAITKQDAGQNLNYAVQWFIFAAITLIGYGFFLRRGARDAKKHLPGFESVAGVRAEDEILE
ncbi:MAG: SURF1 family protein [Actinomycetota bacterium]|nr:SURF1 family protein [Actinomycetota bacterium]